MARRPGRSRARPRELSPYERRIARYIAAHPGATRQEARGHKAIAGKAEHIVRRERAIAAERLLSSQQQQIRRWADKQSVRLKGELDRDEVYAELKRLADERGFGAFEAWKAKVQALHTRRRVRVERWKRREDKVIEISAVLDRRSQTQAEMEAFADLYDLDWRLLYYH